MDDSFEMGDRCSGMVAQTVVWDGWSGRLVGTVSCTRMVALGRPLWTIAPRRETVGLGWLLKQLLVTLVWDGCFEMVLLIPLREKMLLLSRIVSPTYNVVGTLLTRLKMAERRNVAATILLTRL